MGNKPLQIDQNNVEGMSSINPDIVQTAAYEAATDSVRQRFYQFSKKLESGAADPNGPICYITPDSLAKPVQDLSLNLLKGSSQVVKLNVAWEYGYDLSGITNMGYDVSGASIRETPFITHTGDWESLDTYLNEEYVKEAAREAARGSTRPRIYWLYYQVSEATLVACYLTKNGVFKPFDNIQTQRSIQGNNAAPIDRRKDNVIWKDSKDPIVMDGKNYYSGPYIDWKDLPTIIDNEYVKEAAREGARGSTRPRIYILNFKKENIPVACYLTKNGVFKPFYNIPTHLSIKGNAESIDRRSDGVIWNDDIPDPIVMDGKEYYTGTPQWDLDVINQEYVKEAARESAMGSTRERIYKLKRSSGEPIYCYLTKNRFLKPITDRIVYRYLAGNQTSVTMDDIEWKPEYDTPLTQIGTTGYISRSSDWTNFNNYVEEYYVKQAAIESAIGSKRKRFYQIQYTDVSMSYYITRNGLAKPLDALSYNSLQGAASSPLGMQGAASSGAASVSVTYKVNQNFHSNKTGEPIQGTPFISVSNKWDRLDVYLEEAYIRAAIFEKGTQRKRFYQFQQKDVAGNPSTQTCYLTNNGFFKPILDGNVLKTIQVASDKMEPYSYSWLPEYYIPNTPIEDTGYKSSTANWGNVKDMSVSFGISQKDPFVDNGWDMYFDINLIENPDSDPNKTKELVDDSSWTPFNADEAKGYWGNNGKWISTDPNTGEREPDEFGAQSTQTSTGYYDKRTNKWVADVGNLDKITPMDANEIYHSIQKQNAEIQKMIDRTKHIYQTGEKDTLYTKETTDYANNVLNVVFVVYYVIYIFLSIYVYTSPSLSNYAKWGFIVSFFLFPMIVGIYSTYFSNKLSLSPLLGRLWEILQYIYSYITERWNDVSLSRLFSNIPGIASVFRS